MKPNRWIELSRRFYGRLLYLYPKEYRLEYGPSMLQVFNDQCRSAYQNGGVWGLIALWFRILLDLGISALREQVSSPRSSWGLLEAIPNAPLPWKGVAMVLVPGLIFFVAQIGQLSGQDWFDLMVYRAAYFLIIPVILVGAITRKFPIWGLVPLGLFFNTAWSYGYRLQYFYLNQSNSISSRLMYLVFQYQIVEKIVIVAGPLSLMAILVWLSARRRQFSPWAWAWIGIYLLLIAITMRYSFLINLDNFNWKFYSENISPAISISTAGSCCSFYLVTCWLGVMAGWSYFYHWDISYQQSCMATPLKPLCFGSVGSFWFIACLSLWSRRSGSCAPPQTWQSSGPVLSWCWQ